jgi:curved DNA-binding protein CbpA
MIEGMLEPQEAERKNLFRDLIRKWHPDKNPEEDKDVVTAIFQYINANRQIFLAGIS